MFVKKFIYGFMLVGTVVLADAKTVNAAPQWTEWGQITSIEAGWVADAASLRHSSTTMVNPSACPTIDYGYMTNPDDAGHSWFHTIALSAFLNRKQVAFLVDGCYADKPRIISIKIQNP
ncbi:hypothetical protein [Mesorhizobium sp. STM 4661]|uniref:hypothetical protein n=1 Tax=Mesorhizobium sp. STM 4661 TaxID=1297570 RepID=UPI0002BE9D9F|nr:hypothetical protein [Mesorhizobium sp. STM 4661]CCV09885.1 exported hypothetical protein [Mesorhizobium sp. STM 4661]